MRFWELRICKGNQVRDPGSSHWISSIGALARVVLGAIVPTVEGEEKRLLDSTNIGADSDGYTYTLGQEQILAAKRFQF